ncbi:MAG: nucleotide sugar dehydrogenase [Clostridia bacterium]|nr:nucleotide sugar dehydrogenase [Clostridia bacterium]
MKNFSISKLAETVLSHRKQLNLTQQELADKAGINRSMLCRLENQEYMPSLDQLTRLANTLQFDVADVFIEYTKPVFRHINPRKIAVWDAGYAGLSVAIMLSRHHFVTIIDENSRKVEMINQRLSPIRDEYIEKYFTRSDLHLTATTDGFSACRDVDFIIITVPTGYDPKKGIFNTAIVESVIETSFCANPDATIVIRSHVPVGFSASTCKRLDAGNVLFSPDFLRGSKVLYDNLYPSRIIVGCNESAHDRAKDFADILRNAILKKDVEIRMTGLSEAEAIAFFSNLFLAMRITCFNELDTYAESKGLNAYEIIDGICLDPRIGSSCNTPSFGYSGFCLPESSRQLLAVSDPALHDMLTPVVNSNQFRKEYIVDRILEIANVSELNDMPNEAKEKKVIIGFFRLTAEKDSINFHDSVVPDIIKQIKANGLTVIIYEPILEDGSSFFGCRVINDLKKFKKQSNIIIANRYDSCLNNVTDKVYTRDLFFSKI